MVAVVSCCGEATPPFLESDFARFPNVRQSHGIEHLKKVRAALVQVGLLVRREVMMSCHPDDCCKAERRWDEREREEEREGMSLEQGLGRDLQMAWAFR